MDGDAPLSQRYAAPPDSFDEMFDPAGQVRPAWQPLVRFFDELGMAELTRRWDQAQGLIHEHGVSFNVYGDAQGMQRPWRLSPLPVMVGPSEFAALSEGLAQRARLLDRLLADLHGPRRALSEGWIPRELVLGHPGFLRSCVGISPPQGRWLHLFAADVVRPPSGEWRVLMDRTQAPSGAGYALENRIIMSRVFPDAFRDCNVQRLALFFRTMRESLAALAPFNRDNPRIVLLSPGPYNATYFEQAFLAQYLGYQLVDGADLAVRDGRVYLKTLGGLHPVDVILRRLNDDYCDPLELRPDSTLGVPGLLEAARQGTVSIANALGSGVLQTSALGPYLPEVCRHLLGEDLKIPSVETWWCGEPAALSHVLANLDRMVIRPAYPQGYTHPTFAEQLSSTERAALADKIRARPDAFVGQERVRLSTTPLLEDQELRSRQLVLRGFLVAREGAREGESDYDVMPGGLSLVAGRPEDLEISVQRGAGSKDTWVISEGPVSTFSLLRPPSQPVQLSRGGGELPSRVADNLFWLGRYTERADAIARVGRTLCARLAEQGDARWGDGSEVGSLFRALLADTHGAVPAPPGTVVPGAGPITTDPRALERMLLEALFGTERPGTLRGSVQAAHRAAGVIRDRISMDTWRILTGLEQQLRETDRGSGRRIYGIVGARLDRIILTLSALSGQAMDGMTRGDGWRFLDMGRRIERASNMVTLINEAFVGPAEREGPLLEAVLEVADSGITYRRRYLASLQVTPVVDLLLTDETTPRSVAFQLVALSEHLRNLPGESGRSHRRPEDRLALACLSRVRLADIEALCIPDASGRRGNLATLLAELTRDLPALSDALSGSYLSHATVARQLAEAGALSRGREADMIDAE